MDPNNVNSSFQDEFDSPLEEEINKECNTISNIDDEEEELEEWRQWARSFEDDNGDVID